MSFSKIIKNQETLNLGHEPFVMEKLSGLRSAAYEQGLEEIGGDLVSIEREAYEKGFSSGEKAGFEFGRQKAEVLFNGLSGILDELSSFKETLFKPCEREMAELSLAIAKKVIRREVEVKKDVVLDCVRAALKAVVAGGEILIKVNPKELDVIQQHKPEIARYGEGVKGVFIEGDEKIAKGGCVIETNFGEIDATMDSMLAEIEEKLRND